MAGLLRKKKRTPPEIPVASMADIGFLLMIFFLVTTTFDTDTGIGMTLPPKLEENQEPPPVVDRNMLKILVNAQGQVLIEDTPSAVRNIRREVKEHILNNGSDPNLSVAPDKAVVSLKTDRQTPYEIYIDVLDEIWMAYFELWSAEARSMGYATYDDYRAYVDERGIENEIREKIPAQLSIAEPDPGQGEAS